MTPEPRNIIICSDGMDNRFGRHNTNVVKFYLTLESSENQKCFYDPGLGICTPAGIIKNSLERHSAQAFSKTSKMPAAIS